MCLRHWNFQVGPAATIVVEDAVVGDMVADAVADVVSRARLLGGLGQGQKACLRLLLGRSTVRLEGRVCIPDRSCMIGVWARRLL